MGLVHPGIDCGKFLAGVVPIFKKGPRFTIFLGAGASMGSRVRMQHGSGRLSSYPSWEGLVRLLLNGAEAVGDQIASTATRRALLASLARTREDFVKRHGDQKPDSPVLTDSLGRIKSALRTATGSHAKYEDLIREHLGSTSDPENLGGMALYIPRLLRQLKATGQLQAVVTTNLDTVLNASCRLADVAEHVQFLQPSDKSFTAETKMIYAIPLHGCAAVDAKSMGGLDCGPHRWVLTTEDYRREYERKGRISATLDRVVANSVFLFLGYGANDPFVDPKIQKLMPPGAAMIFVCKDGEEARVTKRLAGSGKVHPIACSDWEAVGPFVELFGTLVRQGALKDQPKRARVDRSEQLIDPPCEVTRRRGTPSADASPAQGAPLSIGLQLAYRGDIDAKRKTVILVSGPAGCGKTTALKELRDGDERVHYESLRGSSVTRFEEVLDRLKSHAVLILDGFDEQFLGQDKALETTFKETLKRFRAERNAIGLIISGRPAYIEAALASHIPDKKINVNRVDVHPYSIHHMRAALSEIVEGLEGNHRKGGRRLLQWLHATKDTAPSRLQHDLLADLLRTPWSAVKARTWLQVAGSAWTDPTGSARRDAYAAVCGVGQLLRRSHHSPDSCGVGCAGTIPCAVYAKAIDAAAGAVFKHWMGEQRELAGVDGNEGAPPVLPLKIRVTEAGASLLQQHFHEEIAAASVEGAQERKGPEHILFYPSGTKHQEYFLAEAIAKHLWDAFKSSHGSSAARKAAPDGFRGSVLSSGPHTGFTLEIVRGLFLGNLLADPDPRLKQFVIAFREGVLDPWLNPKTAPIVIVGRRKDATRFDERSAFASIIALVADATVSEYLRVASLLGKKPDGATPEALPRATRAFETIAAYSLAVSRSASRASFEYSSELPLGFHEHNGQTPGAINASRVRLPNARLIDAPLVDGVLTRTNLSNAHMSKTSADGVSMWLAQCDGWRVDASSSIERANCARVRMRHACFKDVALNETTFFGADLHHAQFLGPTDKSGRLMQVRNCVFSGASLDGAVFRRCDLSGSLFFRASLRGATFSDCVLRGCVFLRCAMDHCTFEATDKGLKELSSWTAAKMRPGGRAWLAPFEEADFKRMDLAGAAFRRVSLDGAILLESTLFDARACCCPDGQGCRAKSKSGDCVRACSEEMFLGTARTFDSHGLDGTRLSNGRWTTS